MIRFLRQRERLVWGPWRPAWLLLAFLLPANVGFAQIFQDRKVEYFGAGVRLVGQAAWGDYNRDGWVDLAVGQALYQNNGGTSFSFVGSQPASGLWGDYDNDGYLDFFAYDGQHLLKSDHGTGFIDVSTKVSFSTYSLGATWADINADSHLDLYVGGYEDWNAGITYPDGVLIYNSATDRFDTAWQETVYRARGVTAADFDRDGDQDVYVSNYRLQPNRLWLNDGSGSFSDVAAAYDVAGDPGGAYPYGHTIGSAWGDLDNDGYLDLFVGNFRHDWGDGSQDHAAFLRNRGPAADDHFELMDELDGADWQESYATPTLGDYDNDGYLDLFLTTVYPGDRARLYRNDGNWQFTNVTDSVGLGEVGGGGYQAAWADIDNDGDLDLVTDDRLLVNDAQLNGNHWLKVRLEGDGATVNRSAIGAQVRLYTGQEVMTRQVEGGTGQGNQNDLTLHFGLGNRTEPVHLEILWPDGTTDTVVNVAVDQTVSYDPTISPPPLNQNALVIPVAANSSSHTGGSGWTVEGPLINAPANLDLSTGISAPPGFPGTVEEPVRALGFEGWTGIGTIGEPEGAYVAVPNSAGLWRYPLVGNFTAVHPADGGDYHDKPACNLLFADNQDQWIELELPESMPIEQMWIYKANDGPEDRQPTSLRVLYSDEAADGLVSGNVGTAAAGLAWTEILADTPPLLEEDRVNGRAPDWIVDFGGVPAHYIRIENIAGGTDPYMMFGPVLIFAVPEPSAFLLVLTGLVWMLGCPGRCLRRLVT